MTIKILADKVLAFDRGEKDRDGQVVTVRTSIGFCELPDWVAKTDYFKAATKDGSLKAFTAAGESENVLKEQEKLAAIRAEIKAMEEKREMMKGAVNIPDAPAVSIPLIDAVPAVDAPVVTDTVTPDTTTTGNTAKKTTK